MVLIFGTPDYRAASWLTAIDLALAICKCIKYNHLSNHFSPKNLLLYTEYYKLIFHVTRCSSFLIEKILIMFGIKIPELLKYQTTSIYFIKHRHPKAMYYHRVIFQSNLHTTMKQKRPIHHVRALVGLVRH